MSPQRLNITLGTAGHIDHGKTLLTKMLTGCETDRLKEEKERGMSIELGFAPCLIADLEVGIVDVPGHEGFIKTMVAGATSMDGVIFLVAADDGIMPQTREHLDILTLLGLRHGLVALTKIDRVDAARRQFIADQVRQMLHGTFLQDAPVCPISNITGEGYPDFLEALSTLVRSITPKSTAGVFRLPVERAFSVKGFGTVLSGIPVAGTIGLGDEAELLPQGWTGRVAGLEVYGKKSDQALAGQCAAIQFRHWDHAGVAHGNVLAAPGYFAPDDWYVCRLRLLPGEEFTLKNAAQLKFHTGTSEVLAAVYLLEGDRAQAGQELLIQVKLAAPLVAGPGDFFIVRTPSPVRTVGGGMIVEATGRRLKRTAPGLLDDLRERATAIKDPRTFIEYAIRRAAGHATGEDAVAVRAKVQKPEAKKIVEELVASGKVLRLGAAWLIHKETVAALERHAAEALAAYHQADPASPGMTPEQLAEALGADAERSKFLVDLLKSRGVVVERVGKLAAPTHREKLPEKDQKLIEGVEAAFRAKPFAPPSVAEAAAAAGVPLAEATKAAKLLITQGRLVEVDKMAGLLFHGEAVARARQLIEDHIRQKGELQSVDFKYVVDTTRKFAIPLLDYFDRIGLTRRQGYTRYLRK